MNKSKTLTVEEKITELEKLVAWFDSEEFVLEQAVAKYESAQKLADEIQRDIGTLKNTIEQVGGAAE
ncbi:exodeoxyribonuclease VII small subunit [Candidatus Saccharibacteria bacterium]|nr:exodeoxyribonuclease VII small subunit [Candidatus Saccharibacteria bacterium]MBH2007770.1 exodeoxyribonuclease VII small subunit [Candidatus Saccharibacteria bacterium]